MVELPILIVTEHQYATERNIRLVLKKSFHYLQPALTVTVPREDAITNPTYHIGAVWTLTPGVRPPSYQERLAAAREQLALAGGDETKLSADELDLIRESELPF